MNCLRVAIRHELTSSIFLIDETRAERMFRNYLSQNKKAVLEGRQKWCCYIQHTFKTSLSGILGHVTPTITGTKSILMPMILYFRLNVKRSIP